MNSQNREISPRRLLNALAAPIILALGAAGWTGAAQAETCSPLRIESMVPINERVIMEGSRPAAISFHLRAIVKNTNRTTPYVGNDKTTASLIAHDTDNKTQLAESHKLQIHLRPDGYQHLVSGRIVVKRKDNRTPMTAKFRGAVANVQCEGIITNLVSVSDFEYDLTPILRGAKAKRLSGRIRGPSEAVPPRRGNGAPTPRARTSSPAPRIRTVSARRGG